LAGDRQIGRRQTDWQATDRLADDRQLAGGRQTGEQRRKAGGQTGRQADRETDRRKDRQIGGKTDR
jgi:hypothetical protein